MRYNHFCSILLVEGEVFLLDVIEKLQKLKDENNWSNYRIAKSCGLSEGTINNLFKRNNSPSLVTIEAVCNAFGLSLSQFFLEESEEFVVLTEQQKDFFNRWTSLTKEQKDLVDKYIDFISNNNQN